VESADIESGWQGLFAQDGEPRGRAQQLVEGAQAIYSFICAEDDVAGRNLRRWGADAPIVCIPPRPPEQWNRHASDFLTHTLRDVPVINIALPQMLASIATRGLGITAA